MQNPQFRGGAFPRQAGAGQPAQQFGHFPHAAAGQHGHYNRGVQCGGGCGGACGGPGCLTAAASTQANAMGNAQPATPSASPAAGLAQAQQTGQVVAAGPAPLGAPSQVMNPGMGYIRTPGMPWTAEEIARASTADEVDPDILLEVLRYRPGKEIKPYLKFGCITITEPTPENKLFGVMCDPLRHALDLEAPDQRLTFPTPQGVAASDIDTVVVPNAFSAFRFVGVRIEYRTTQQNGLPNGALCTITFAPYQYNRYVTALTTAGANPQASSLQNGFNFSMNEVTNGGVYWLFSARDLASAVNQQFSVPTADQVKAAPRTTPVDAMIAGTPISNEGDNHNFRRFLDVHTTGLPIGAQMTQDVTVIANGQKCFDNWVAAMLSAYYVPISPTAYFFPVQA